MQRAINGPVFPSPVAGTLPNELKRPQESLRHRRRRDESSIETGDGASRQYSARHAYPLDRAMSPLHDACRAGDTEVVKQLLDGDTPVDVKDVHGRTALMLASMEGHTEVVQLLLDKGAAVDEKTRHGSTALMRASMYGHTEVVQLLLDNGASVDEKTEDGTTALLLAITEVTKLLLDKGATVDEKNEDGTTALLLAITEVTKLLLDKGASVDVKDSVGNTALPELLKVGEDQLGRMAAAQVHRHLLEGQVSDAPAEEAEEEEAAIARRKVVAEATATALLRLVRAAGLAHARVRKLRSSDPRSADDHQALFVRLQLAAAACVQNDESGKARGEEDVQTLFRSVGGRKALEHAVQIEAKELLAQPVVQGYIKVAWRGVWYEGDLGYNFFQIAFGFAFLFVLLLLNLLFLLPFVALAPALEPWLAKKLNGANPFSQLEHRYLLLLPIVKFGLECAADLALALALTFLRAADLATAPVAPLLLVWVGSGLLWEARQLMAPSSSDAESWLARAYDRLVAHWGDNINRVDATALFFSFAALVAFVSTGDSEDASATSLRALAVFLLWLRVIRVLLVSPKFGPFVMMFFRMLSGDVLYFLVLLLFLLVAFAASWTVLLDTTVLIDTASSPPPDPLSSKLTKHLDDYASNSYELVGCHQSYELVTGGNVSFFSTLLRLLEGALTANDHFECARNSTKSPVAAWVISLVFVTLTSVLLLNMLIAMCAAATIHSATP
eukprot:scaffold68442_cov60-Phaeocystis_antarctica.AAC.1